jgi:hypothetical protein
MCGRCGAPLQLSPAAIDVHPPRASLRAKQLRRWFPWYRWESALRNALARLPALRTPEFNWDRLPAGILLRMALPGWPQCYMGQERRGHWMAGLYLGLLAAGVLSIGTTFGALLLGTALAVHISSIMDVLWPITHDWRARGMAVLICVAAVGAIVYLPPIWAVSQVAAVRRIAITAGPLHAGDVILYRPSGSVNVGDVVLYEITQAQVQTRTAAGYPAFYRVQGEFIDRIVAGSGQSIGWKNRQLHVDGQLSPFQPLHPDAVTADLQFTVPPGYYGILPSTQPLDAPPFPPDVWQTMSVVPGTHIRGPVVLRQRPIWRWGRL